MIIESKYTKSYNIMEKYIMIFEFGEPHVAFEITAVDEQSVEDGYLTIIRCSDCAELLPDGTWTNIPNWNEEYYDANHLETEK
jgi:formylmethanofuran dehydrogenase subunit E